MYFPLALVAGALFLQTSAFLILPETSNPVEVAHGPLDALWATKTQSYELECLGCPFPRVEDGETQWEDDVENKIHLDFRVDDNQQLRINEAPVFPLDLSQPLDLDVVVSQVRTSDLHRSEPVRVGFVLEVLPLHETDDEPGKKLIRAKFTILDLGGTPVEVDTVDIDLLQLASESIVTLSIVKVTSEEFHGTPGAVTCAGSSKWSLCRLRAIIMARLQEMIKAAKARAKVAEDWVKKPSCNRPGKHAEGWEQPKEGHHYRPNGGRHHKHRKLHHMFHRFGHMVHQAIRFFIIPALLGIIGGLMASAIGMLVGQVIVYTWFRFHRNGQRGHVRLVEVAVVDDEKDALLEPSPQYEDVEAVVVEDDKE